ncbi:MAG TPA: tripartite tricarboxylate transporter substrate-binding protein [Candidatus Limnocylindria bacterium]|jgi:putative tricarboxylic transport membrane protein|nr:tripartite tricarboxylate transporter substrate-binding protein [Candidatus Limnocylindria bacterium]
MTRIPRILALFAATAILAAACGGTPAQTAPSGAATAPAAPKYPTKNIDIMAPAATGGGFDTTARLVQRALTEEKLVSVNVTVSNVPGAGGTVGMAQLLKNKGDSHSLIVVGRVTIGSQVTGKTEAKVSQLTPVARLMAESEVIVTPKDSPYKSIKDVIDALKKDVNSIKFAGGSAGGIDHELAALLVKAAGGDVKAWKSYVPFAGGGEAAAAIIGGQVQIGISGYGEFKGQIDSGTMKALAVSAEQPLAAAKTIPTLKSQGVDITIVNWRLLAAPPEISASDLAQLKELAKKVHDSKTWQDFATKNDWFDNFTTTDLSAFVSAEERSLTTTLTDLGLVK